MNVSLSIFKENPAKYFELAKTADVIVTRRGKRLGRVVNEENAAKSDMQRAIEALIGSVAFPSDYDNRSYDPDYEIIREAACEERGLL